jgi:hypothetical protein
MYLFLRASKAPLKLNAFIDWAQIHNGSIDKQDFSLLLECCCLFSLSFYSIWCLEEHLFLQVVYFLFGKTFERKWRQDSRKMCVWSLCLVYKSRIVYSSAPHSFDCCSCSNKLIRQSNCDSIILIYILRRAQLELECHLIYLVDT